MKTEYVSIETRVLFIFNKKHTTDELFFFRGTSRNFKIKYSVLIFKEKKCVNIRNLLEALSRILMSSWCYFYCIKRFSYAQRLSVTINVKDPDDPVTFLCMRTEDYVQTLFFFFCLRGFKILSWMFFPLIIFLLNPLRNF
jgi:hypothetical protein